MSKYHFSKPNKYENWFIFKNAAFNNLKLEDCVSSVTGKCEKTENTEQCIEICKKYENCSSGYFIKTKDKDNICIPLFKFPIETTVSPYYRLRNKNMYPELKNVEIDFFIQDKYEYPPVYANLIFYLDRFTLTNIETGKSLGLNETGGIDDSGNILTKNPIFVQFFPVQVYRTLVTKYIGVKNGDEVFLSIPDSSYILKEKDGKFSWELKPILLQKKENSLTVFCKDKQNGEYLNYNDTLFFKKNDKFISFDGQTSDTLENLNYYKTVPKIQGYYCHNNECKSVYLENTERDGFKARFKGSLVSRNPNCWGLCEKPTKARKETYIYLIITFSLVFILLFCFLFLKWKKKI